MSASGAQPDEQDFTSGAICIMNDTSIRTSGSLYMIVRWGLCVYKLIASVYLWWGSVIMTPWTLRKAI